MNRKINVWLFVFFIFFYFSACSRHHLKNADAGNRLVIASPHPLALINPIIENFENESGIDVLVFKSGTGEIISNVLRYPDTAPYDILWGGSYTSVLPFAKFFEKYKSCNEDAVHESYKNSEGMLTRFSDVPSVLMINRKRLGSIEVNGYADLLNPLLKGQIAFADPEFSSSSWEHLINMLFAMGNGIPENGWSYVEQLCLNLDGKIQQGSSAVYEGVAKGSFAVGLTFEEGAANYAQNDSNISIVYMKEGVVFTPDGIYLLKNARNPENAKRFIDYATAFPVQNYISRQLNRRSVRSDIAIKQLFLPKDLINCIEIDHKKASVCQNEWISEFHNLLFSQESPENSENSGNSETFHAKNAAAGGGVQK